MGITLFIFTAFPILVILLNVFRLLLFLYPQTRVGERVDGRPLVHLIAFESTYLDLFR